MVFIFIIFAWQTEESNYRKIPYSFLCQQRRTLKEFFIERLQYSLLPLLGS